jgi:hypothetical protein
MPALSRVVALLENLFGRRNHNRFRGEISFHSSRELASQRTPVSPQPADLTITTSITDAQKGKQECGYQEASLGTNQSGIDPESPIKSRNCLKVESAASRGIPALSPATTKWQWAVSRVFFLASGPLGVTI